MGNNKDFDLTLAPSDAEFAELREHIKRLDSVMESYRQEMGLRLGYLLKTIESNPTAVRRALGLSPMPTKGCAICGLDPCGCERRNDR